MPESDYILEVKNVKKIYNNVSMDFSKGLSVTGRKTQNVAVNNVSFNIKRGEAFGIVGESGCGKSTLARTIVGLIKDAQGEIILNGEQVMNGKKIKSGESISRDVQIVFQDPLSSLNPKKRIGWIMEEPLRIHRLGSKEERIKRVNEMLELVGLDVSYRERFPNELSGGQRQRVSIGAALMLKPKLIIADEPVSALDVSVQAQILNLMQELQQKFNFSYLFISHDLNVIYYMCQRVGVMYKGQIVELASAEDIYKNPVHSYTKALIGAMTDIGSDYELK